MERGEDALSSYIIDANVSEPLLPLKIPLILHCSPDDLIVSAEGRFRGAVVLTAPLRVPTVMPTPLKRTGPLTKYQLRRVSQRGRHGYGYNAGREKARVCFTPRGRAHE